MSSIDDSIREVKKRLHELAPLLDEQAVLRSTLKRLEDLKLHDEDPVAWKEKQELDRARGMRNSKQQYLRKQERLRVMVEVLRENPEITNVDMAKILGITAAWCGRLRDEAEERLKKESGG